MGLDDLESNVGDFTSEYSRAPEKMLATKFRFGPQHVLYGKLRPYLNKVALPDFDGVCTTEVLPILPDPDVLDRRYLYAILLSQRFVDWATDHVSGANLPRLAPELLATYEFAVPPLSEQRAVSEVLNRTQQLRRQRGYAIAVAKEFLPAAFLRLFGDPASNPLGFPVETLESLFAVGREGAKCGPFGTALRKSEYVPSGIPVWTMNNVAEDEFREEGCLYISSERYETLKPYAVQSGDILISRAGTIGRMAVVNTQHRRSIIHTNLIRLSLNPCRCLPGFFTALMTYFAARIGSLGRGQKDAYTFMSTGRLAELRIPVPPLQLQQKYASVVREHERLRAKQRESLRQTEYLFGTLLNGLSDPTLS